MFSSEIKVNGKYVSGTIKKVSTFHQGKQNYAFHSELRLDKTNAPWTAIALVEIANELQEIARKIDELNK